MVVVGVEVVVVEVDWTTVVEEASVVAPTVVAFVTVGPFVDTASLVLSSVVVVVAAFTSVFAVPEVEVVAGSFVVGAAFSVFISVVSRSLMTEIVEGGRGELGSSGSAFFKTLFSVESAALGDIEGMEEAMPSSSRRESPVSLEGACAEARQRPRRRRRKRSMFAERRGESA